MAAPQIGLWPPAGGETGALIREHDWASSPLGPMEDWPTALKVAVGMMLASSRGIAVYWGPDFICLYNDTYRDLLGEKHPSALGRPAREVFPEALDLVGPLFKGVMKTGEAASGQSQMLPLERGRASLGAWFTYTAEPIFAEDGSVAGIFNPASEVSLLTQERRGRRAAEARGDELAHQIESQRRAADAFRERENHFRRIADAAPALLWVTGEDNKCTYVSRSWYEFTGMKPDDALGFGWFSAIHRADRRRTSDQFLAARAERKPFQLNHRMKRHDGAYRWVLDSGAPRYDQFGGFVGYVGSVIDVDDRQRAEEALRRSEGRYASLFGAIDEGFCVLEILLGDHGEPVDYRFVEINPTFEAQTGLSDAAGRTARELIPDLEQRWIDAYGRVALTQTPVRFEDYSAPMHRWFDVYAFPLEEPERLRVGLLFRDVTQRKQDEAALQASAERAEFRVRLADVLRTARDADSLQREATALLAYHLGVDRVMWGDVPAGEESLHIRVDQGPPDLQVSAVGVHPIHEYGALMVALLASGETVVFTDAASDMRLSAQERQGAHRLDSRASIIVPVIRRGSLVAVLTVLDSEPRTWTPEEVAVVEETADRTRTALERTIAEGALRASEERFRRLADSMPQLVWVADPDGNARYYNVRRDAYDGLTAEASGTWGWQAVVHPDDQRRTIEAWETSVRQGAPYECEHRIRMKDGSYRWHLSRAELVETDGTTQWYGTATDIHQLKLTDELKDRFLAIASHELRNPVSVIHGTAQQIRRARSLGTMTDERFESYLDSLMETSTHLAALTNDLTDVSRLQRGSLPLNLEPTDIAALVRDVASHEDWAPRVHLATIEGAVVIEADRHRMRQVVTNLIDNALKYSPDDTPVEIQLLPNDDGTLIEVRDHGIGFSTEDLNAIFTPFGRALNSGTVPGLGMGLFIAREIVERHGGDLRAVSEGVGLGATFSLWLPTMVPPTVAQEA